MEAKPHASAPQMNRQELFELNVVNQLTTNISTSIIKKMGPVPEQPKLKRNKKQFFGTGNNDEESDDEILIQKRQHVDGDIESISNKSEETRRETVTSKSNDLINIISKMPKKFEEKGSLIFEITKVCRTDDIEEAKTED